jgi:hypothetical protein
LKLLVAVVATAVRPTTRTARGILVEEEQTGLAARGEVMGSVGSERIEMTTGTPSGVGLAPALVTATTTARGVIMIVVTTGRGLTGAGTITGKFSGLFDERNEASER